MGGKQLVNFAPPGGPEELPMRPRECGSKYASHWSNEHAPSPRWSKAPFELGVLFLILSFKWWFKTNRLRTDGNLLLTVKNRWTFIWNLLDCPFYKKGVNLKIQHLHCPWWLMKWNRAISSSILTSCKPHTVTSGWTTPNSLVQC